MKMAKKIETSIYICVFKKFHIKIGSLPDALHILIPSINFPLKIFVSFPIKYIFLIKIPTPLLSIEVFFSVLALDTFE